jgi:hypothetical protein
MPVDKRELILSRVLVIMQGLAGITTVARNRGLMTNEKRPAMILLDGDEVSTKLPNPPRSRSAAQFPQVNTMRPEMYILLQEDRPTNLTVGQQLNAFRIALSAAIATDTALAALLGPNGSIYYYGCVTDLKSGAALSGQMKVDYQLSYVFDPT